MRLLILFCILSHFIFGAESSKDRFSWTAIRDRLGNEKSLDMFARDRVGQPFQIGAGFFTYDLMPQDMGISVSGSGLVTHNSVEGLAIVSSGAGVGTAKFRTHQYHLYQPDKAQEIDISIAPMSSNTGTIKKWGYFDDNDGLYYKLEDDNILQACVLTSTSGSPVESCTNMYNFNSLDVNGVDFIRNRWTPDGGTIYRIQFQWLGTGVAKFCMVNDEGDTIILHTLKNPLKYTKAYMKRGALPVSFEIETDGTNTEGCYMKPICYSVVSNGGEQPTVQTFAAFLPTVGETTNTDETHIMSFRLKDQFKGQVNTTTVFPQSLDLVADGGTVRFRVYQNCTVSGASWTDVNTELSAAEYSTAGTLSNCDKVVEARTLFGSTKAGTTIGSQGSVGFRAFKVVKEAFNGGGVFSVTVQRVGSNDAEYDISLRWGESR